MPRSQAENLPAIMQQQRSSAEYRLGTSEADPDTLLNNLLQNYLPPSGANISYFDISNQGIVSSSIWNSVGSNFNGPSPSQSRHGGTTMDLEWTPVATNAGVDPMLEEINSDMNINLNSSQVDDELSLSLNYNSYIVLPNPDHSFSSVGISNEVRESRQSLLPISRVLEFEDSPSSSGPSNPCQIPLGGSSFTSRDGDVRVGSTLEGHSHRARKRTIQMLRAQPSDIGSTSFFLQNESSFMDSVPSTHNASTIINISDDDNSSEEQLCWTSSTTPRGMTSEYYPSSSVARNAGQQRNFRPNSGHQPDVVPPVIYTQGSTRNFLPNSGHQLDVVPPVIYTQGSTIRRSIVSSPNQPSSYLVPHSEHVLNHGLARDMRSLRRNEASSSRSNAVNNIPEATFARRTNIGYVAQEPTNWSLENGSTWLPHQNPPTLYPQNLTEAACLYSMQSGGLNIRGQSNTSGLRDSGPLFTPREIGLLDAGLRGHQQQPTRPTVSVERRNNSASGVPPSRPSTIAARGLRRRRVPEDALFNHPMLNGRTNLNNRQRGMLLDVDNMSYEELLALEELIGNVSTGLSEETILERLKQWKYLLPMRADASDEEPCCICQEEYIEGDDIGALDCEHDFHAACIKQWLMHKNLCPICKLTGLGRN